MIKQKFGENISGRGHWDERSYMCELFANDSECLCLTETPKNVITKLRRENCDLDLNDYPMYVLMHYNSGQNKCKIERLFSCGDDGIFSNDKPCVLLLKEKHFYNVWGHDFLFNDVDTPKIGTKRKCGSAPRYKKLFCLCCMVSYSNDYLHVCSGRCHHCLDTNESHDSSGSFEEKVCDDCDRVFLQEFCYESHKAKKLRGEYESYCDFLCTLLNCDDCRRDFSLSVKCRHFGKKKRRIENVFFSNDSLRQTSSNGGVRKYVKCGYCSDFYFKGFTGSHHCFLKKTDSIFGDEKNVHLPYTLTTVFL